MQTGKSRPHCIEQFDELQGVMIPRNYMITKSLLIFSFFFCFLLFNIQKHRKFVRAKYAHLLETEKYLKR